MYDHVYSICSGSQEDSWYLARQNVRALRDFVCLAVRMGIPFGQNLFCLTQEDDSKDALLGAVGLKLHGQSELGAVSHLETGWDDALQHDSFVENGLRCRRGHSKAIVNIDSTSYVASKSDLSFIKNQCLRANLRYSLHLMSDKNDRT